MSDEKTLYARLGGYDAIAAVADNLVSRLRSDARLGRFWANRGEDGVRRETQFLIDFLCHSAGGPLFYTGRDMKTSHKGMKITQDDWSALLKHLNATLDHFRVPAAERSGCGFRPEHKGRHRRGLKGAAKPLSIRALLENKGWLIGSMDLLIAAHAQLTTNNEAEFKRLSGLRVDNWI